MITAAADTTLQDGRDVCVVYARELRVGDVILADGAIDLAVDGFSDHPLRFGFVIVDYSIGSSVTGSRAMVADSPLFIKPREDGGTH